VLEIRDLAKHHQLDRVAVRALDGVSMTVARGQFVAVYGPSGSGKTTLLDLIIGLRSTPDGGSIRVDGREVAGMSN
jgi:ABC-type lipoprotein export system ATPase subunit